MMRLRKNHSFTHPANGFTIVELLIVIIIIGLLAAIIFVSYRGISTQAHVAVVKSYMDTLKSVMAQDKVLNGAYPTSASSANNGKGLPQNDDVTLSFHSDGINYCITVTSSDSSVGSYNVSNTSEIQPGKCAQDSGATVATLIGAYNGYAESPSTVLVNNPSGLTAFGGDLYFLDSSSPRLRKVTTSGTSSFLAGTSSSAYAEGLGASAKFNWPQAVTADDSGNLYIADTNNNRIRKVDPTGQSSLLAGTGSTSPVTNGACTSATFSAPRGIVYYDGVLYVSDSNNHIIRSITLSGCTVATFAGTAGSGAFQDGKPGKVKLPEGLAADSSGNIYLADTNNNRIRKITSDGTISTLAGNGTAGSVDGSSSTAEFSAPQGVAVASDGTVYVADSGNSLIRKITPDGTVSTIAGNGTAGFLDGQGTAAEFNHPNGITLIGSTIYVADTSNNRIRVLTNI